MERDPHLDERISDEKHPIARMIALGVIASLIGIAIALAIDWFPADASTAAGKIDTLYDVLLIFSVPVFVLVMTIAIYSVYKFRARPGDMRDGAADPRQHPARGHLGDDPVHHRHRARRLRLDRARRHRGQAAQRDGRPGDRPAVHLALPVPRRRRCQATELVLPKDQPVEFRVNTDDVLHDFWVPAFRLKTDAVPGLTTQIRLTPDRFGSYDVVCAELCGLGHSTMRAERARRAEGGVHVLGQQAGEGGLVSGVGYLSEKRRDKDVTLTQKLIAPGWYRAALGRRDRLRLRHGDRRAGPPRLRLGPAAAAGTRSSPSAL